MRVSSWDKKDNLIIFSATIILDILNIVHTYYINLYVRLFESRYLNFGSLSLALGREALEKDEV